MSLQNKPKHGLGVCSCDIARKTWKSPWGLCVKNAFLNSTGHAGDLFVLVRTARKRTLTLTSLERRRCGEELVTTGLVQRAVRLGGTLKGQSSSTEHIAWSRPQTLPLPLPLGIFLKFNFLGGP